MKAMIFAAGLGTRFKPWTDAHPKALAVVNGKPLLQRNIEYLQKYGITDVIVNVHHFADQITEAIKNNNGWGSEITLSDEREVVLETGGGLLKAKDVLINNGPFVIINVDVLTNLDLSALISFFHNKKPLIAIGVTNRQTSRNFLFDEEMQLCGWRNKSTGEEKIARSRNNYIERAYSCVAVFDPSVFTHIKQSGKFSLTETYLDLARDHVVLGYDHSGDHLVDVGKPESVALAEAVFT
jgi:MurNAc alpha-1-phosphate uridylyltransferase